MFFTISTLRSPLCRIAPVMLLAGVLSLALPSSSHAQEAITPAAAAAIKASFLDDIDAMRDKFIGLAEAFPQATYSWRPMDGTRSVSEVLMLIASEGYGFAPTVLGGEAAMTRDESQGLSAITDKAQVIDHLTKGFAYAKAQIEAIDPATLVGTRTVFGRELTTPQAVLFVSGDMHEHLGQLIAYARANEIVPPWSR